MIQEPIWSTWPKHKGAIDDYKIFNYYESIKKNGYRGQIEIDADWEVSFLL